MHPELKAAHKGDCQITIEQTTVTTKLAISSDSEKPPRILSQVAKRQKKMTQPKPGCLK